MAGMTVTIEGHRSMRGVSRQDMAAASLAGRWGPKEFGMIGGCGKTRLGIRPGGEAALGRIPWHQRTRRVSMDEKEGLE
jgi:hypothetical protein